MPIDEQKIILNLQNNLEHKPITEEDLPGVSRIGLLSDDTLHFEYDPVTVYGKRPDMIDNTIGMPTKGIRDKALNGLALGVAGVMTLPVIAEIGGGLAATEMGPVILSNIGRFGWKVLNHPITQTVGTIDGFRNLLSGNGVQKTYNHFKNREYGRGTLSLAGDVLDASPLLGVFKAGITSIKYGNKYEIPWGWKHIEGNFYSLPTGRKIEWPGGESHAIITPEAWWSKNRRYTPPVPDQDEVISFDRYIRNTD